MIRQNGNKVTNHRQQTGKENPSCLISTHKDLRSGEFRRRDKKIFTPAKNRRAPQPACHPIHDRGAGPGAERPGNDDANERHAGALLRCRDDGRRRIHNFTGDRENGTFEGHEPKNSRISARQDPMEPNFNEVMHVIVSDLGF